jgi:transposase
VALAHTMVVSAWHMRSTGEASRELGGDYFTQRYDPERQARRLTHQLEQLGYNVSVAPLAPLAPVAPLAPLAPVA